MKCGKAKEIGRGKSSEKQRGLKAGKNGRESSGRLIFRSWSLEEERTEELLDWSGVFQSG